MDIRFFVPGNPKGLKRHRTFTKSKGGKMLPFARTIDPSEGDKKDFLAKAMEYRPNKPLEGPLVLEIVCVFARPKSHFRTGKNKGILRCDAPTWYESTPDWDNVGKFVGDALNGVFWDDDRKIVLGSVAQIYGNTPGVCIRIRRPCESVLELARRMLEMGECRA